MSSAKCDFIAQAPASWSSRLIALLHKVYFFTVALSSTSVLLVALGIGLQLHAQSQTEVRATAWPTITHVIGTCATPLFYSATLLATTVWLWQDLNTITESHLLRYLAIRSTMSVLTRNGILDSAPLYPFGANVVSYTVVVEVFVALIVCLFIPFYKPEPAPTVEPLDEVVSS